MSWLGDARRARVLVAGGALALALAVTIARASCGESLQSFDRAALVGLAELRASWLTKIAIQVTALGSTTICVMFTLLGVALLLARAKRRDALQLAASTGGAWLLQRSLKALFAFERPTAVAALVESVGFAYPSGHALNAAALGITVALLLARGATRVSEKRVIVGAAIVLIALVVLSRVYLGVHGASDVVGGSAIGVAWALLVDLAFNRAVRAGTRGTTAPSGPAFP